MNKENTPARGEHMHNPERVRPYLAEIVSGHELTDEQRLAISNVLPSEWFPEDPIEADALRTRGWMQIQPYAYVLIHNSQELVGTTGLVDISTADSPFLIHGIADVAVVPEYRGQGIGGWLLDEAVNVARRREAGAIIAATTVGPVIHSLQKKGFRAARPREFYFNIGEHPGMSGRHDAPERPEWDVAPDGRVSNTDWWVWRDESLADHSSPIRIKQDF